MNTQNKWIFAAVAIVSIGFCILLVSYLIKSNTPALGSTSVVQKTTTIKAISSERSSRSDSLARSSPLLLQTSLRNTEKASSAIPSSKLPLSSVYAELKELAANGNADAACRISYELSRCEQYSQNLLRLSAMKGFSKSSSLSEKQIAQMANVQAAIDRDGVICQGFVPNPTDSAFQYLLLAAELGKPESMLHFSVGGNERDLSERSPNSVSYLTYQQNAQAMFMRALSAGLPEAYAFAIPASTMDFSGVQLLPRDNVQALAYTYALAEVADVESREYYLGVAAKDLISRLNLSENEIESARSKAKILSANIKLKRNKPWSAGQKLNPTLDDAAHCDSQLK